MAATQVAAQAPAAPPMPQSAAPASGSLPIAAPLFLALLAYLLR
ncbi:hypothetical protein KP509_09G014600 [Ceratopteris richardii]|nr:hypothetical protein KP509_09G014600 [Ceratopteris richardii]